MVPSDVSSLKAAFPATDEVGPFHVFDIGGNKSRLIAIVDCQRGEIFIRCILDRSEDATGHGRHDPMNAIVEGAAQHWRFVSPLLNKPATDPDDDSPARLLDEVLSLTRGDCGHELAGLASAMGDLLVASDEEHRPMTAVGEIEALRYLILEHGIAPEDLPEIGPATAVAEILSGRAPIDAERARLLGLRFGLPGHVFLSHGQLNRTAGAMQPRSGDETSELP